MTKKTVAAPAGAPRPPPATWLRRLRYLGPSVVITGSIVGSGELVLTTSLGAAAGIQLLWWVLLACWVKSLVQAELARYVVVSGDTYLQALNRIPGKLPWPGKPVSWTVWISLLSFIPGTIGMGGIIGGAGQAVSLLIPELEVRLTAGIAALAASAILFTGSYVRLERIMMVLVLAFTCASVIAFVAMQSSSYALSFDGVRRGLEFRFPIEYLVLALAMYGATGVNAAEIAAYCYWCGEKGYSGFIAAGSDDPAWLDRARGWIRVLHLDVWLTLSFLTCATLPFFLLGAGVLHSTGQQPQGLETVSMLSAIFTETLGDWALWLFGGAAFCILFSSAVAGLGGTARLLPDFLVEFGLLDRRKVQIRKLWIRAYGSVVPVASYLSYLVFENPLLLLSVGALTGALLLPVQSGATMWLQQHRLDHRIRPSILLRTCLWLVFMFQTVMAGLVIWYVIL